LKAPRLKEHTGVSAAISFSIPIFDWGASRSREQQARLRVDIAENERTVALRGFTQQFYAARAQVDNAAARISIAREGVTKSTGQSRRVDRALPSRAKRKSWK
jgi:outer membrane protein TolC